MCSEGGSSGRGSGPGRLLLAALVVALLLAVTDVTDAEVLTPPYFNLAEKRRITATATCGEREDSQGPELYCKLVGANADREGNINLIQGQVSGREGEGEPWGSPGVVA